MMNPVLKRIETLNLYNHNAYGHQTWQSDSLASRISFSIMFEYFSLASKMKIEIIEAKHQTCFFVVGLELRRSKTF